MKKEGFFLTYEAYERLTRARLGDKCDYCYSIENSTPASPRHNYKFCPECGRYREGNYEKVKLMPHPEKFIVSNCIGFMESVHESLMEYMELMDVEHTEGKPYLRYSNFEIVQRLLLSRTTYGGGTSTIEKCRQLGMDPYGEVIVGE